MSESVNLFELFAQATTQTQSNDSSSISLVMPSLLAIHGDLTEELSHRTNLRYTSSIAEALVLSLYGRFGGLLEQFGVKIKDDVRKRSTFALYNDRIFPLSTFLDGKFKLHWLNGVPMSDSEKHVFTDSLKRDVHSAALAVELQRKA